MDVRSQHATVADQRRRRRSGAGRASAHTVRVLWLLAVAVALSPQLVGALHVPVVLGISAALAAVLVYALWTGAISTRLPLPALCLALLAGYTLLQALPLPTLLWGPWAKGNLDAYSQLFDALGENAPKLTPVSLDPGASRIEAVKWSAYAVTFALAAGVGARGFPRSGPAIVHVSALAIALVTLAHRLAGAHSVFGIYFPSGEFARSSMGPLLNPNNLAGYLNLGIFCGFGLMIERQPPWLRWLLPVSVALMIGLVIDSRSRGGLVALGVGFLVLAPLSLRVLSKLGRTRQGRRTMVGVGLTVLVGATFAGLAVAPDSLRQGTDGGLKKLAMASWVLPLIRDYPVFGVGRGAFESAFQQYMVGPDNLIFAHPENFIVQWAAEWGLPCTALLLLGLFNLLRPVAVGALHSPVALGAFVACCALLLQNLVDLGTEVPALVMAGLVAIGTGWSMGEGSVRLVRLSRAWSWGLVALTLGVLLGAVAFSVEPVGSARMRLGQTLDELPHEPHAQNLAAFRDDLKRTMRAHPADPYFPRLAALLAFRQREPNALRWIGRALELGPTSGRSHFLLAQMLASLGQTHQALLELRLTAAYDPGMTAHVAHAALRLSKEPDELQRAAPQGEPGARVLLAMADELKDPASLPLRMTLLRASVGRFPDLPAVHRQLAKLLSASLERRDASPCENDREVCVRRAEEAAQALERLLPTSSEGVEARARLLLATARSREANELLQARCDGFEERRSCLTTRLKASLATGDIPDMERAIIALSNQTCRSIDDCADLFGTIGDLLARAGRRQAALPFYVKAAKEDGKETRWLRVADLASELGEHGLAVQALFSVQVRRMRPDPKLQAKMDSERTKLLLQSSSPRQ